MPLLKTQRNALLLAIQDSGINPSEFTYTVDSARHARVIHTPSRYYFEVRSIEADELTSPGNFTCVYSPGEAALSDLTSGRWHSIFTNFGWWLGYLEREITQPDLWEALAQSRLPDTLPDDNSPFTEPERQVIKERLGQIRDYAYRVQPELTEQPEWGRRLEAKIDYLTESSERVGHKDWYNIFIGTIVSYIFSSTMDSNAARDFLEFAWQTIHQVLPSLPYKR